MLISKLRKNNCGFTLVEVMVASLILIAISAAFLDTLIQYSSTITSSVPYDIALNAAQAKIEEFKGLDSATQKELLSHNGDNFNVNDDNGNLIGQGSVSVSKIGTTNLFDITVKVVWKIWRMGKSKTIETSFRTTVFNSKSGE